MVELKMKQMPDYLVMGKNMMHFSSVLFGNGLSTHTEDLSSKVGSQYGFP